MGTESGDGTSPSDVKTNENESTGETSGTGMNETEIDIEPTLNAARAEDAPSIQIEIGEESTGAVGVDETLHDSDTETQETSDDSRDTSYYSDEDEEDQVPMGIMGERPLNHKMLKSGCEDTHDSATGETWFGPHKMCMRL